MLLIRLGVEPSLLEEIIDGSRESFSSLDTPTRVRNLLDYFDSTQERTILGPLRNQSMLLELVTYIIFPYPQGHHASLLSRYFEFYLSHSSRSTIHVPDIRSHISGSQLRPEWKNTLISALIPTR